MSPEIRAWLRKWRARRCVRGRCFEAAREGLALFPELYAVVGATSRKPSAGPADFIGAVHCWLVDESGAVVDPTAHQYDVPRGELDYWPFREQPADPTDPLAHSVRHSPTPQSWTKDAHAAWLVEVDAWCREVTFWPSTEQPPRPTHRTVIAPPPPPERSAVLTAMLAIHKALLDERAPSGFGGRYAPNRGEVNGILDRMLTQFVELGARFAVGDLETVDKACGAYATNGSFSALDDRRYAQALAAGNGSAAASWEAAHKMKPWGWSGQHMQLEIKGGAEDAERPWRATERRPASLQRVGPRSALLIDGVWWRVYSFTPTELRLAAYPGDDGVSREATAERKGVKRMTLTRESFAEVAKREQARLKQAALDRRTLKVPVVGRERQWPRPDQAPRTLEAGLVVPPSVLKQIEEGEKTAERISFYSDLNPPKPRPYLEMSQEERDAWHAACDIAREQRVAATEIEVPLTEDRTVLFTATVGAWRAALPE